MVRNNVAGEEKVREKTLASSRSWNRYSYINNTPTSFIDQSGFAADDPMDEIIVTGVTHRGSGSATIFIGASGALSYLGIFDASGNAGVLGTRVSGTDVVYFNEEGDAIEPTYIIESIVLCLGGQPSEL